MNKIIFDCDNTMGLDKCDVDDGLALLYLLGRSEVALLGITTTFGNSQTDIVFNNTKKMLKDINITNIPLLKGALSPANRKSEAADFLLEKVNTSPNEITILATGSLTNLLGAYEIDNTFFSKVKNIVLMGGILEPLIINEKKMDELNFSCDPVASHYVLSSNTNVTVLTGHICLDALFGEEEYSRLMDDTSKEIYQYIKNETKPWFEHIMKRFDIKGFYNWDVVAAVYITHPELFDERIEKVVSTPSVLKTGLLKIDDSSNTSYNVNIPRVIVDLKEFNNVVFKAWGNVIF